MPPRPDGLFVADEDDIRTFDAALFSYFTILDDISGGLADLAHPAPTTATPEMRSERR